MVVEKGRWPALDPHHVVEVELVLAFRQDWMKQRRALAHPSPSAQPMALKRQTTALARMARETMAAIE